MSSLSSRFGSRDRGSGRSPIVAVLDIGSTKITCMIARRPDADDGQPRVIGVGVQASKGVKAGAAVDLGALERSIRLSVEQAEREAGVRVTQVVVGVGGPDLRSDIVRARLAMSGREIAAQHIREVRSAALDSFAASGRETLHVSPLGFVIDAASGVRDPRGMFADTLSASYLVVSAPSSGLRNIMQCIARAHLVPVGIAASPFASGVATLIEDEAEHGATVIDLGGGVTGAACFSYNALVHLETLPIGGAMATQDLAHMFGTTIAAAEKMKCLNGAVGLTEIDALEMVDAPRLGVDGRLEAGQCTRADVVRYLRPRVEELLELMDQRLSAASARGRPLPRRIVLTGGQSQAASLRDLAEDVFRAPVRIARPNGVRGLSEACSTPAFAAAVGLLKLEMKGALDTSRTGGELGGDGGAGLFRRVASWLQENF